MNVIKSFLFFTVLVLAGFPVNAQTGRKEKFPSYFGIIAAPVFPTNFLGSRTTMFRDSSQSMTTTFDQKTGFMFGASARFGLTKRFSIETGLTQVRRTFNVKHSIPDSNVYAEAAFSFVSYDLPLNGLVYIQLGEQTFMNAALGFSITHYPSDIRKLTEYSNNYVLIQEGRRTRRTFFALNAAVGFEYRTEKSGTFYIGGSAKIPVEAIMFGVAILDVYASTQRLVAFAPIDGNYFSFDVRYYLPNIKSKEKKFRGGPIE